MEKYTVPKIQYSYSSQYVEDETNFYLDSICERLQNWTCMKIHKMQKEINELIKAFSTYSHVLICWLYSSLVASVYTTVTLH